MAGWRGRFDFETIKTVRLIIGDTIRRAFISPLRHSSENADAAWIENARPRRDECLHAEKGILFHLHIQIRAG